MFPKQPANNYGSNIRTESPFSAGLIRRSSAVPAAYSGPNASRSAFARALSDDATVQNRNNFDLDNVEYQQKAIKARAADVQARRESQVKAGGMDSQLKVANTTLDTERNVRLAQQASDFEQTRYDIDNFTNRAKRDATYNTISAFANAAYNPLMKVAYGPSENDRYMALKAAKGGGPYEGITSADILAAGSGYRGAPGRGASLPFYDMPTLGEGASGGPLRALRR